MEVCPAEERTEEQPKKDRVHELEAVTPRRRQEAELEVTEVNMLSIGGTQEDVDTTPERPD